MKLNIFLKKHILFIYCIVTPIPIALSIPNLGGVIYALGIYLILLSENKKSTINGKGIRQ